MSTRAEIVCEALARGEDAIVEVLAAAEARVRELEAALREIAAWPREPKWRKMAIARAALGGGGDTTA